MGYGWGFYKWGMWFGFGQIQFTRWIVTLCLFKLPGGYNRHWIEIGKEVS